MRALAKKNEKNNSVCLNETVGQGHSQWTATMAVRQGQSQWDRDTDSGTATLTVGQGHSQWDRALILTEFNFTKLLKLYVFSCLCNVMNKTRQLYTIWPAVF